MRYNYDFLCSELDQDDYILIQNSQDLNFWLEFVALPVEYWQDITGAIVVIGDGDLIAIWLTESSRYYDLNSTYYSLPYYRPKSWTIKNLPEYWLESNQYYHK